MRINPEYNKILHKIDRLFAKHIKVKQQTNEYEFNNNDYEYFPQDGGSHCFSKNHQKAKGGR